MQLRSTYKIANDFEFDKNKGKPFQLCFKKR